MRHVADTRRPPAGLVSHSQSGTSASAAKHAAADACRAERHLESQVTVGAGGKRRLPAGKGSSVFKVFAYLTKREGSTREALMDYYENHHVPLVLSLAPMPRVYKRNYLRRGDAANLESPAIEFDVVTEMVWDDRAGFENWITSLGVPAIAEDEARFLDRSKTKAYVIDEGVSAA
jgi:hypothetical protein